MQQTGMRVPTADTGRWREAADSADFVHRYTMGRRSLAAFAAALVDAYSSIDQWRWTCELVWKHFTNGRFKNGVASGAQLAFLLSKTLQAKRFEDAVALFQKDGMDIDEAIELSVQLPFRREIIFVQKRERFSERKKMRNAA